MKEGETIEIELEKSRYGWIQVISGALELDDGQTLSASDGAAIHELQSIPIKALSESEFLFFDLP